MGKRQRWPSVMGEEEKTKTAADHRTGMRRVGKPKAGCQRVIIGFYTGGIRAAVDAGDDERERCRVEIGDMSVGVRHRSNDVVAQSKVQRQSICDTPIVLGIKARLPRT